MRSLALVLAVALLACSKPPAHPTVSDAARAATIAAYTAEIETCLQKGKAEKSVAAYKACADRVDAQYAEGGK